MLSENLNSIILFLIFVIVVVVVVVVLKFCCTSLAVADANLQIRGVGRGGGGWSSRPGDKRGGGQNNIFRPLGPQFGLNIRGDQGPSGPSPGYATD